jgi:hypothetical protein
MTPADDGRRHVQAAGIRLVFIVRGDRTGKTFDAIGLPKDDSTPTEGSPR